MKKLLITANVLEAINHYLKKGYKESEEKIETSDTDEVFKLLVDKENKTITYIDNVNIVEEIISGSIIKHKTLKIKA